MFFSNYRFFRTTKGLNNFLENVVSYSKLELVVSQLLKCLY